MPAFLPAAHASSPLPALPIVPIVPEIPPIDAIFHPCVVVQRTSTDLIVYTHNLGHVITIAYPLGPLGVRIVPSGIFSWMERHGLVLECFCALLASQPTPARFVDEFLSRHTVVRCHYVDNQCGFYLDLTKIHMMTMFESLYEQIPTLSFGAPNIPSILTQWRWLAVQDTTLLQHPVPFVNGYFSIHVSMYPGIQQLRSGLLQPLVVGTPHRRAFYHLYRRSNPSTPNNQVVSLQSGSHQSPRHRASAVRHSPVSPVAGPSRLTAHIPSEFSEHESEALDALKMGLGIDRWVIDDLFEWCDHCGQSFMRSALRMHVKEVGSGVDTTANNAEVL